MPLTSISLQFNEHLNHRDSSSSGQNAYKIILSNAALDDHHDDDDDDLEAEL